MLHTAEERARLETETRETSTERMTADTPSKNELSEGQSAQEEQRMSLEGTNAGDK